MRGKAVILLGSAFLGLALMPVTQEAATAPAASITQLMQAMIIPSSNAIFNVGRQAPQNDEEWAAILNSSVILAESGILLTVGGRARDDEVWRETSRALGAAGEVALKAAMARDVEGLLDAGNLVIDSCERCNEVHFKRE